MERGKAWADTGAVRLVPGSAERAHAGQRKLEALSTVAACAGGPVRSSGEAPVMGVDAKGPACLDLFHSNNRNLLVLGGAA